MSPGKPKPTVTVTVPPGRRAASLRAGRDESRRGSRRPGPRSVTVDRPGPGAARPTQSVPARRKHAASSDRGHATSGRLTVPLRPSRSLRPGGGLRAAAPPVRAAAGPRRAAAAAVCWPLNLDSTGKPCRGTRRDGHGRRPRPGRLSESDSTHRNLECSRKLDGDSAGLATGNFNSEPGCQAAAIRHSAPCPRRLAGPAGPPFAESLATRRRSLRVLSRESRPGRGGGGTRRWSLGGPGPRRRGRGGWDSEGGEGRGARA